MGSFCKRLLQDFSFFGMIKSKLRREVIAVSTTKREYTNQIAEVMRRRGMRQAQLARALKIKDSNVHRVIHSDNCTLSMLFKIAEVLEVPVYYLVLGYELPPLEPFTEEHIARIAPPLLPAPRDAEAVAA